MQRRRRPRPHPGLIFHSDRGCQYTSARFAALADDCARHAVRRTHRTMLGQRPRRKLFRLTQTRMPQPAGVAQPRRRPPGDRRIHCLVQRHQAAQRARLPDTQRIRSRRREANADKASVIQAINPVRQSGATSLHTIEDTKRNGRSQPVLSAVLGVGVGRSSAAWTALLLRQPLRRVGSPAGNRRSTRISAIPPGDI
jgi:hypothetical protein